MDKYYYTVQFEAESSAISCNTLQEVFSLLKKNKFITILRYNDVKTGSAYAKIAAKQEFSVEDQKASPIFIETVFSDEGIFVKSEEFWIENYLLDEFYNPDKMPHIEKMIA